MELEDAILGFAGVFIVGMYWVAAAIRDLAKAVKR
jgi:hypothetical protein